MGLKDEKSNWKRKKRTFFLSFEDRIILSQKTVKRVLGSFRCASIGAFRFQSRNFCCCCCVIFVTGTNLGIFQFSLENGSQYPFFPFSGVEKSHLLCFLFEFSHKLKLIYCRCRWFCCCWVFTGRFS